MGASALEEFLATDRQFRPLELQSPATLGLFRSRTKLRLNTAPSLAVELEVMTIFASALHASKPYTLETL